jgi:hypothetical protein
MVVKLSIVVNHRSLAIRLIERSGIDKTYDPSQVVLAIYHILQQPTRRLTSA